MKRIIASTVLGMGGVAAVAAVVPGSIVLQEGDLIDGSAVTSCNAPFTDGNGKVGMVVPLADGRRAIWYEADAVFLSSDAAPDSLTGGETTMGVSNTGGFIYSPSVNGEDAVYTHEGLLLRADDAAPGIRAQFITFCSRPRMLPDGTAFWVSGLSDTKGGGTNGRALYKSSDVGNPSGSAPVIMGGDIIEGSLVASTGIEFTYEVSDNGSHLATEVRFDDGDNAVVVNGAIVAREEDPTGQGDNWDNFDTSSINNNGIYVLSGDTDGSAATDEFITVNDEIVLRQGDAVDSLTLGSSVDAVSINNLDQVAFVWDSTLGETLFLGDADNLADSRALLSVNDELDVDGDEAGDWLITDFNASGVVGPGLDLGDDGAVYVEVDMEPVGGGANIEAVVRLTLPGGPVLLGDLNCDGNVSVGDINAFVLALTDPDGYAAMFPDCDILAGDCSNDGQVTVGDINCFVALVTGG